MAKSLSDFNAKRTLFLFSDFYQDTAEELIKSMLLLDAESSEDINIMINSYGGAVFSLFAILDAIKSIKSPVNTICLGEADSCGAVLLSAGVNRYIGENSRTMIHEVSTFTWGKISEIEEQVELTKEINDNLIGILSENTGVDHAKLANIMKKDTFLDAAGSVKLGLVDEILEEPEESDIFTDKVKSFADSFHGAVKDGTYNQVFYNAAQKPVDSAVQKTIVQQAKDFFGTAKKPIKKKGVNDMKEQELIANLKEKYDVDVAQLISDNAGIPALEASLVEATDAKDVAEKALADISKEAESKDIENLLEQLITDVKSTQVMNDEIYRTAFEAMGYEAAVKAATNLQVIAKVEKESVSTNVDESEISDADSEHAVVTAYAKEHNVDYSTALTAVRANSKKGDS